MFIHTIVVSFDHSCTSFELTKAFIESIDLEMQNDGSEAYDNTTNQSGIHVEEKRERANNNLSLTKSQHKANPKKKGKKLVKLPVHRQIRPIPLNRTNTTSDKNTKSIHEGSSLGPILNHVSSFNFSSISCIKRRTGLVRRTHSPLTTVSSYHTPQLSGCHAKLPNCCSVCLLLKRD